MPFILTRPHAHLPGGGTEPRVTEMPGSGKAGAGCPPSTAGLSVQRTSAAGSPAPATPVSHPRGLPSL